MDDNTLGTVFSTLVATAIASMVAILVALKQSRIQQRAELKKQIEQVILLSIQYPYLEDDVFCAGWSEERPRPEEYQRYDSYCCLVFNLIYAVYEHFKGDLKKVEAFLWTRELIERHRKWWTSRSVRLINVDGYSDPGFHAYVEECLKELS